MDDRLVTRPHHRVPERPHVVDRQRVHHGRQARDGDLNQAKLHPVAVFRDKLRIETDNPDGACAEEWLELSKA